MSELAGNRAQKAARLTLGLLLLGLALAVIASIALAFRLPGL